MSRVALVRCESYNYDEVENAVKRGLDLLGGIELFTHPGEKILLKPNMVAADPPEKCATTHYTVVKAAAEQFKTAGAIVSYGDSPGIHSPEAVARISRIAEAAEEAGIELADFNTGAEVFFEDGVQNKKFFIAKGVLESDGLVSLPKLKTHGLAMMTGCIKNQFGCIPGVQKAMFHARIPNIYDFAQMLVDLNSLLKPRLYIMDAIYAMEGNGPRSGNPRKVGLLLFSDDPVAVDAIACRLIGLKPENVPVIKAGAKSGQGTFKEDEIELLGDPMESFYIPDFDIGYEHVSPFGHSNIMNMVRIFRELLITRPFINKEKCSKCGICIDTCPVKPKAIKERRGSRKKPPLYTYKHCIRCYCCQEFCPAGAIQVKETFLSNVIKKIFR